MSREAQLAPNQHPVDRENQLIEWLLEFEAAALAGMPVPPEVICRECPELLSEFQEVLKKIRFADAAFGDDAPAGAGSDPLPPDTDRYRFEAFLARGGMGEAYRGEDRVLKRTVAIKVLRRRLGRSISHRGGVDGGIEPPRHRPGARLRRTVGRPAIFRHEADRRSDT